LSKLDAFPAEFAWSETGIHRHLDVPEIKGAMPVVIVFTAGQMKDPIPDITMERKRLRRRGGNDRCGGPHRFYFLDDGDNRRMETVEYR